MRCVVSGAAGHARTALGRLRSIVFAGSARNTTGATAELVEPASADSVALETDDWMIHSDV